MEQCTSAGFGKPSPAQSFKMPCGLQEIIYPILRLDLGDGLEFKGASFAIDAIAVHESGLQILGMTFEPLSCIIVHFY